MPDVNMSSGAHRTVTKVDKEGNTSGSPSGRWFPRFHTRNILSFDSGNILRNGGVAVGDAATCPQSQGNSEGPTVSPPG